MFKKVVVAIVLLILIVSGNRSEAQSIQDGYIVENWKCVPITANVGQSGIEIMHLPGQFPGILTSRNGDTLSITQHQFGPNGYGVTWISDFALHHFDHPDYLGIIHEEFAATGHNDVLILFEQGFSLIDLDTKEIKTEYEFDYDIKSSCMYDINNDGYPELIYIQHMPYKKIVFLDLKTLTVLKELEFYAQNILVGQVDADPNLEIVFENDDEDGDIYVYDLGTDQTEWTFSQIYLEGLIKDIDDDGMEELFVKNYRDDIFKAFDVDSQTLKWEFSPCLGWRGCLLKDIDNDGHVEMLFTSSYTDSIFCYNAEDTTLLWESAADFQNCYNIESADVDLDGVPEVLMTTDDYYDGYKFFVVDSSTRQTEFTEETGISSPVYFDVGNMDNQGSKELLVGFSNY
ncbi:VCBS repeat-containing protein, partial [bacterium]|nr:VCBS repeat-containing protein [bacterium]